MDQIRVRHNTEPVLEPSVPPVGSLPLLDNPAVGLTDSSPEPELTTFSIHLLFKVRLRYGAWKT